MSQWQLQQIAVDMPKEGPRLIDILELTHYLEVGAEKVDSLTKLLHRSFKTHSIGVDLPSRIYFLIQNQEVVATVFLTPIKQQSILNGYYIYNVCTAETHRGQGLMKHLLSQVLQQEPEFGLQSNHRSICLPSPVFHLQVAPNNQPAYQLYLQLGFKVVEHLPGADLLEWSQSASPAESHPNSMPDAAMDGRTRSQSEQSTSAAEDSQSFRRSFRSPLE